MTLQTISVQEQQHSSESYDYIPKNNEKSIPEVPNGIGTSTVVVHNTPASTEPIVIPFPIYVPASTSIDILYDNYGHFYHEMANLSHWGCDPKRVNDTFTHTGKLVFYYYTIPAFLAVAAQLAIQICGGIFVGLFIGLPWISTGYWRYGVVLGAICTTVGLILYIALTVALSAGMVVVFRQQREKAQRLTQDFLNKEMDEYYRNLGISLLFYYMLFQVYSGRGMIRYYKPRIQVTINSVR